MTGLTIVAAVATGRENSLGILLRGMNIAPGRVNPQNAILDFSQISGLHFFSLAILPMGNQRSSLVLLADFDPSREDFLQQLVRRCEPGLRRIFSFCEGFGPQTGIVKWMRSRERRPFAYYTFRRNRSVVQCREEDFLHAMLREHLQTNPEMAKLSPTELHRKLQEFAEQQGRDGTLQLTPETGKGGPIKRENRLQAVLTGPAISLAHAGLKLLPRLKLRALEQAASEPAARPEPAHVAKLAEAEDHGTSNVFIATGVITGTIVGGTFRNLILRYLLRTANHAIQHRLTQGRLGRLHTIRSARLIYLDGGRWILAAHYDGCSEALMDDLIHKEAASVNALFGNTAGYPATRALIHEGACDEQTFRNFMRSHQLAVDVWFDALEGLTAFDMLRNTLVRERLERQFLEEAEAQEWASLL